MLSKGTQNAYRRLLVVELPTSLWNRRGGFDFISRIVAIAKLPAIGVRAGRKVSLSNAEWLGILELHLFADGRGGRLRWEVGAVPIETLRESCVSKDFLGQRSQPCEK